VLTADPGRTKAMYPGVKCFDVTRGRFRAILSAMKWCDIAVAGGGELVQDQSSLLYSPFNLLPIFLAFIMGRKSYAWAVGIGQGKELTPITRLLLRLAVKMVKGVTVRDRGSFNTLHHLGLREPEMLLASDCALSLELERSPGKDIIGAAPRDVSNRNRHLMPLELRKKLGLHRETDNSRAVTDWARLLDWYAEKYRAEVVLFPFHTGTLSNDDHVFCRSIDGAILAFASGTIPVSVSYSSKCIRFMEQAGLDHLVSSGRPGIPDRSTAMALEEAWNGSDDLRERMKRRLDELSRRSDGTLEHFRRTFLL
jgi:polysaccharide pyruvyl transferase WcaK-like protein